MAKYMFLGIMVYFFALIFIISRSNIMKFIFLLSFDMNLY